MKLLITLSVLICAVVLTFAQNTNAQKQQFIEKGKIIYEKFVEGGWVDDDWEPIIEKAPPALQLEAEKWENDIKAAGLNVDDIIKEIDAFYKTNYPNY